MSQIKVLTFKHTETQEELANKIVKIELKVEEIENTYEQKKEFVGGYIDFFSIATNGKRSIDFIVNDEGLLNGLPPTVYYQFTKEFYCVDETMTEVLVGNIMLVAVDETNGETTSLTDEEIEYYSKFFTENKILVMNPQGMFISTVETQENQG